MVKEARIFPMKEEEKKPLLFRFICWVVWLFSPKYELIGTENLPEGPSIIVGNHCHMYGPISSELYTPGMHDTWCAGEMMHREEVAAYAYQDFWSGKPRGTRWFYRILSHLIIPIAVYIFNNASTIAVYHDTRLLTTFRQTIQRLQEGSRIVIFPECYDVHNNIVHGFQDKFIDAARFYYRKTGKALSFVPMYLAPKLSKIIYGQPIVFRPDVPIEQERRRICDALMDAITEIAVSLPEHTVIPYPNISKKHYGKNIPLEVYTHEQAAG